MVTAYCLGKRVSVSKFLIQKRASMSLRAINFRIEIDEFDGLRFLIKLAELLLVCDKDVIVRTNADFISQQSRTANGLNCSALFLVIIQRKLFRSLRDMSSGIK